MQVNRKNISYIADNLSPSSYHMIYNISYESLPSKFALETRSTEMTSLRNQIPKETVLWERHTVEQSTEEGSWLAPEIYLELYVVNTYGLVKFKYI